MTKPNKEDSQYILIRYESKEYITTWSETKVPIEHIGYDIIPKNKQCEIINRLDNAFNVIKAQAVRHGEKYDGLNAYYYFHSEAHTFGYKDMREALLNPIPINSEIKHFMTVNKMIGEFPSVLSILSALEDNIAEGSFND